MQEIASSNVITLIENNDLLGAAQELAKLCKDSGDIPNVRLQIRRINENSASFNAGTISYESFSVNKSRIALALLDIASTVHGISSGSTAQEKVEHYYNLGNINLNNKEYYRAILYFSKAIISSPRHVNSYIERGAAKCAIGSYEEASQDLSLAIDLSPDNPFAYFNRGITLYHLGKLKNACSDWRKVRALGFDIADEYLSCLCAVGETCPSGV